MCPRAQPGRQISETKLAPFPWCTFKEGSPAHSPPWAGKVWGIVPSTLSLVPPSGIIVNAHQKPHSGILCQESVPWSVSQKPLWAASMLCSAHTGHLHINTQLWLKCNYHWQDTSWDPGPQSCCQALLLPQANPFTALSPCKAGDVYSIFTQTTEFMGQNYCIRAGHQCNGVSAASHLQHSHLVNSRKLNTPQKLTIPRSLPNTQIIWDHLNCHLLAHYRNVIC